MAGTNYRVDRVAKQAAGNKHTVPCGMNSIVYLDNKPPSISRVVDSLGKPLEQDEVLLFSKWVGRNGMHLTGDYVVSQVVEA